MKTEEIMVATEKLRKTGVSTEQANKNLTNYSKGLNMSEEYIKELKEILEQLKEIDNKLYKFEVKSLIGDDVRTYSLELIDEIEDILEGNNE